MFLSDYCNQWKKANGKYNVILFAMVALHHFPLVGRPVCPPADRTREPLVALLVARVTHCVVGVPTRRGARPGAAGTAIRAYAATLKIKKLPKITAVNKGNPKYITLLTWHKRYVKNKHTFSINH